MSSRHPQIYAEWPKMSEALMNGPSPLTPAERKLIRLGQRLQHGYVNLYPAFREQK
jgi:hypothetical protein